MAFLKQIIVTLAVLLLGGFIWLKMDPGAGRSLLALGLPLPGPVRTLVAALSPMSEAEKETAAPRSGASAEGGNAGGGKRGGRGGGGGGPTIVVSDRVSTAVTRNQMRAIGSGEAIRSVTVFPDVTGIIQTVPFKSGDEVAVGARLAILENGTETLAVDRARIGVSAAEEKLARVQRLQQSRTASSVEVGDAARELDNARLDLRGAEIALEKRNIVAPIAGRVGIVSVDTGDLVNNQTVITTIDDRSSLKVIFYTPENFVQELRIGQPISAIPTARPENVYNGHISAIDSRLDEASRTLKTEAAIDNPEDELRPGMSFTMTLNLEGETLLSVDPLSVQWERTGPIVWKIAGEDVAKVPVRIVERNIDRVLVTSQGLKEGDDVVVEGVQAVREGGKVAVQNPRPPAEAVPTASMKGEPQAALQTTPETGGSQFGGRASAAELLPAQRGPGREGGGAAASGAMAK